MTLTSPADQPPVRTQADLDELWRSLMGPLGFGRTTLWTLLLEADGRVPGDLLPLDGIPTRPTDVVGRLTALLRHLVPPGGSVAFLLTRPGVDSAITPSERAWVRALEIVGRNVGTTVWPVHRANDEALHACTPDDLAA